MTNCKPRHTSASQHFLGLTTTAILNHDHATSELYKEHDFAMILRYFKMVNIFVSFQSFKKKSISYPTWYSFLLETSMPLPISMPCPCRIIWDLVIIIHSYFITKVALCLGLWRICMGFAMQYNSYLKVLIFSIHSFSNFVVKWWSLETDNLCITDLDHFGEVVGKWYKASIVDHLLWNLVILLVWWNVFISGHHESSFIKHP